MNLQVVVLYFNRMHGILGLIWNIKKLINIEKEDLRKMCCQPRREDKNPIHEDEEAQTKTCEEIKRRVLQ